jgi:aminoglycoside phosphotransferase (APT) family kinase protein
VARQITQTAPAPAPDQLVPVAPVPDLDLVLQVFPFDQRLPALYRLMTGRAPRVEAAIVADLGPGEWQVTAWAAEALRYRVDQRAMVRVTATARNGASGASEDRRLYAKLFREGADGARAHAVQRALWERAAARTEAFAVARPVAYLEAAQTLLLAEVAGTTLRQVLATAPAPSAAVRQTARAVADLHRIAPDEVPFAARRRPARDESARLDKTAAALRDAAPDAAAEIDAVVDAIVAGMDEAPSGPTHFDLKPGHILVDPPHVTLLDFDKLALADPLVDVANFLVFLGKERSDRSTDGGEHDHVHHFLDEYLARVPAAWRAALPARTALALLAEAATTGRGLRGRGARGDRAAAATAAVEQARRALAERF